MSSDESLTDELNSSDETTPESDRSDGADVGNAADSDSDGLSDVERLAGRIAILEAENQRLRDEYARIRRTRYRQAAVALVGVGLLAALGGLLAPAASTVLLALAGTGVFLGILTYYLAPERFLPASVGREVYTTLAANEQRLVAGLGLSDDRIYVPLDGDDRARLYVPQRSSAPLPDVTALDETFVVDGDHRGVAFRPTGASLFDEFERALAGTLASTPDSIVAQLADALVEQFELVESAQRSVEPDATAEAGQVTLGVDDSAYGPLDQFDHPVASFLGVGLARGLGLPVAVSVELLDDGRVDAVVTCRWPVGEADG